MPRSHEALDEGSKFDTKSGINRNSHLIIILVPINIIKWDIYHVQTQFTLSCLFLFTQLVYSPAGSLLKQNNQLIPLVVGR